MLIMHEGTNLDETAFHGYVADPSGTQVQDFELVSNIHPSVF